MATHYTIEPDIKYEELSVQKVLITLPLIKVFKEHGIHIKNLTSAKIDPDGAPCPLSKMDDMKKMFDENTPLPPIVIKQHKATEYYSIIDGRHRFAMSIIVGYSIIPFVIS